MSALVQVAVVPDPILTQIYETILLSHLELTGFVWQICWDLKKTIPGIL